MPRITDKAGRELRVGSRIERVLATGKRGGMVGEVFSIGSEGVAVDYAAARLQSLLDSDTRGGS